MARGATTKPIRGTKGRTFLVLNVILAVTAVAAVAALILEHGGFDLAPRFRQALHVVQMVVVAVFILDRVVRVFLAPRRLSYVRENWIDFAVMAAAVLAALIGTQFPRRIVSAGALYVVVTQIYILVSLVLHAANLNVAVAESGISPPILLLGSFLLLCLVGSGLLMLPAAVQPGSYARWWYPDALFTAVSATCVTGLIVVDTGQHFTPFGQTVILVLIQLGGLGLMLFGTVFAMLVGRALSVRGSTAMGEMLSTDNVGQIKRVAIFVVLATLLFELVGAILLYPMFAAPRVIGSEVIHVPTIKAVWDSIFHSVSSFCNAGFSLYSDNMMEGVRQGWQTPLRDRPQMLCVLAPLIVLGGLGFPVLHDCFFFTRNAAVRLWHRVRGTVGTGLHNAPRLKLSLHTKIVLSTSAILLVGGMGVLLLVEPPTGDTGGRIGKSKIVDHLVPRRRNDWTSSTPNQRIKGAVFQSITARTAGFNTVDMSELSNAGKLTMCALMTVGGSPASTAGGMKTVTLALLLLAAWSVLMRREDVEIYHRSLPRQLVRKAVTLAVLYLLLVFVVTVLLSVAMREEKFIDVLFEACSACGTVGLSTGVTKRLNLMGKYVVIAGMFIGRLGLITVLLALTSRLRHVKYTYPHEHVIIG